MNHQEHDARSLAFHRLATRRIREEPEMLQTAIGMIKLLSIAQDIVENSTATEAQNFDAAKWLGQWIETPQPALGGLKPADLIDTPTGVAIVARVLGSLQSGAYL